MLRLDSEYQKTGYLAAIAEACQFGATQLKDDNPSIIHPQEIAREYVEDEGVWFLRAQNVRPLLVDTTNRVLISKEDAEKLTRNRIEKGDVLVTRTGANRGQCAYFDREEVAIASSHTFIIRPKTIDPEYLAVFMNTRNGIAQIDRGVYGAAQPEIAPYYLKNIWVPNASAKLVSKIKQCFSQSKQAATLAEQAVGQAEETLLVALGLADWTPPEPLSYAARASDAFAAGRLDAEHFRPKFAAAMAHIAEAGITTTPLHNLIEPLRNGVDLREFIEAGTPYIRVGDIKGGRIEIDTAKRVSDGAVSVKKSIHLKPGDILFTRKGSFGNAAVVGRGQTEAILSTEIMLLRLNEGGQRSIIPDYLSAFFNSQLGKLQAEQWAHGVAFYSVTQDDLYKFEIPLPDKATQRAISAHLDKADELRSGSRGMLETAKRAVEIAIEDGEPAALAFLDEAEGAD